MITDSDRDTKDLPTLDSTADADPPFSSLVKVDIGALSDTGKVRPVNEDHFLVGNSGRYLDVTMTNIPEGALPLRSEEKAYGMVVADGMGGAAAGEVASREAISTLINLVLDLPDWILRLDERTTKAAMNRAAYRYKQVDAAISEQAEQDPRLSGMGTTLTVAFSLGEDLILTHVGDSRAYLLRKGRLQQLTRDQTLVQALIDIGEITPEEASSHPMRHILTQALGQHKGKVNVEVQRIRLRDGDWLLLCTDGLTEMVPDDQILKLLDQPQSAESACRKLVDLALENGGRDNVTVIAAHYDFPDD